MSKTQYTPSQAPTPQPVEESPGFFGSIGNAVSSGFSAASSAVTSASAYGMGAVRDVIAGTTNAASGVAGWAGDTANAAWEGAGTAWDGAVDLGGQAITAGSGLINQGLGWASDTASSTWEGAKALPGDIYHGLTDWHFEGRDQANGKALSQQELDADKRWRLMSAGESIYHDNGDVDPSSVGTDKPNTWAERKYVRDDPDSFLGLGGYEAVINGKTGQPMEGGPYQATYNYCNPSKEKMLDGYTPNMSAIGRNVGHLALDVVPYWFGGTVRGNEGTNAGQRMLGPKNYQSVVDGYNGVTGWASDTASGIGTGISKGFNDLTGWAGSLLP